MELKTKTIGNNRFQVRELDPFKQLDLFNEIVSTIGGALGEFNGQNDMPEHDDYLALISLAGKAASGIDSKRFTKLLIEICQLARFYDEPQEAYVPLDDSMFKKAFTGSMMDIYKLAAFVLEVQFGDFLSLWGKLSDSSLAEKDTSNSAMPTLSEGVRLPQ